MKTMLIVYHSMTGGTKQMADAAAAGARREQALTVSLLRAADAGPADVLAADGYLFATPENLAAMSGLMKDFFDRTYYAALDRLNGRPYATLVCAGSDGRQAAGQIERIATGWRADDRLHPRASTGGNPAGETDLPSRPRALRGDRRDPGSGDRDGDFLNARSAIHATDAPPSTAMYWPVTWREAADAR
jgi:flavodoxin